MTDITSEDLKKGSTYRAKRPRRICGRQYNDRTIVHLSTTRVQYDGPAVHMGQHYPMVSVEKFLKWAGHEIKDDTKDN